MQRHCGSVSFEPCTKLDDPYTKLDDPGVTVICQNKARLLAQACLPEIEQLTKQLSASAEELSDVRFQLEEDKATASAAQVQLSLFGSLPRNA